MVQTPTVTVTYQGETLPFKDFRFEARVGCDASFVFTQCLTSQVASFKSTASGDLVINDGRPFSPDITFKDIYFVRAEEIFGNPDTNTDDMCQLVLADKRITWHQRSEAGNYNTITSDRTTRMRYEVGTGSSLRDGPTLVNLDSGDTWIFTDVLAEANTDMGFAFSIDGTPFWTTSWMPFNLIGKGRTIKEFWEQWCYQSFTYLVPTIIQQELLTNSVFNTLGVADSSIDPKITYADYLDKEYTIEIQEDLHIGSASGLRLGCNTDLYVPSAPQSFTTQYTGSPAYDYDCNWPVITSSQGNNYSPGGIDTWKLLIEQALNNIHNSRDQYAGWHPIKLGHFAQSVEWVATPQSCHTTVRRFYAPTKEPKFKDTYHTYGQWPLPNAITLAMAEVTSLGTGGGIYNCQMLLLDATLWATTSSSERFIKSGNNFEVFNMAENRRANTHHLAVGDQMVIHRHWDDESNMRWLGRSPLYAYWHA